MLFKTWYFRHRILKYKNDYIFLYTYSCKIENLQFIDERINEIINNLNVETEEIKEEIKEGIEELKNEIEYLNNNFADLNIEIKEEIKEETNKITKHDNEIIILKQIIQNIQENEK